VVLYLLFPRKAVGSPSDGQHSAALAGHGPSWAGPAERAAAGVCRTGASSV
jgi:hypothetical protein